MATIDVTNNGVVFNDQSAAAQNGDAIEDILENQASDGDVIDFPFSSGDICYVEGNSPSSDGQRAIDVSVAGGLAQNLTIQGRTDANDEPVGEIKIPDSISGWHYLLEVSVGSGLTQTVQNLKFNYNQRGHNVSTGGSCIYYRDQNAGTTSDIQFTNCYLQGGYDVIFRVLDVNGVTFDGCTFDYSETNHCLAVDQKNLSKTDAAAARCRATNCFFQNAEPTVNGGTAVNASPGNIVIEDCVVDNCGFGFKGGTESGAPDHEQVIRRVRCTNIVDRGYYNVPSPTAAETTLEDFIVESTTNGAGIDIADSHDVTVADGSIVVLLNCGDDGIILRDSSQLQAPNAELQVCGSASDAYRFSSDADSTWDVLTRNNNTDGVANFGSGTLTINSENTGTPCQTDIAGVPTTSEVGVGTGSTTRTLYGIKFDTVLDAVDDLGLDDTGNTDIIPTLQNNVADGTLVEFPPGTYLVDGQLTDSGANKFGLTGLGSDPTDVVFETPDGVSQRFIGWEDQTDLVLDNFSCNFKDGTTDGILQIKVHINDGLEMHDITFTGYWPSENETTVNDGSGTANLINFNIKDPDGSGVIDNISRTGPATLPDYPDGGQGIFAGTGHDGEMTIKNCTLANMPLHGIYASRTDGPVIVDNCDITNVNGDMVRVSGDNSVVQNSTFTWDAANDHPNNVTTGTSGGDYPAGMNGIENESGFKTKPGVDVINCLFVVTDTENSQGCIYVDGSVGACELRGNEFEIVDSIPVIQVKDVGDSLHNLNGNTPSQPYEVDLTDNTVNATAGAGSAVVEYEGRDDSVVDNICIEASDPADGIEFDGTQNATVKDSTINVSGSTVTTVNGATVSTTNIDTSGTCSVGTDSGAGTSVAGYLTVTEAGVTQTENGVDQTK